MFPLNFTCTVERAAETEERSGQRTKAFASHLTGVKCLFLETAGNKVQGPQEGHRGVFAFYTHPNIDINEGDHIINITDKKGNIIEAGPLYVESAKRVPSISGAWHHTSYKLTGAV